MASSAVVSAVEARVTSVWSVTDSRTGQAVPVFGLNTVGQPPKDGKAYLQVQYPVANAEQVSIGAPGAQVFREEGGIRFVLSVPAGGGVNWWLEQLEALLAQFRAKQFSGVNTWAPSSPVLDNSNDQGPWLLTAAVPYYYDTLG